MPARPRRRRTLLAVALPALLVGAAATAPAAAPAAELPTDPTPAVEGIDPLEAGLSGPVSEVLEDAPDRGAVRLVLTATGSDGGLEVETKVAEDRAEAAELVREARQDDATLTVGLERRYHAISSRAPRPVTSFTATSASAAAAQSVDPGRGDQWALTTLGAESAWERSTGVGTVVAVVDSGVDKGHPDLRWALAPGFDFLAGTAGGTVDPHGHGTHVAGIIAASASNGIGVAGLAPGAKVMPVRVLDRTGSGWNFDIAEGVTWAADHGADVINLSLAGPDDDPALAAAIAYARLKDVVVVAAVGNSAGACAGGLEWPECGNPVLYPAATEGVVGVGATSSPQNRRALFSEHGPQVDVVAPGADIVSTYPRCTWDPELRRETCSPVTAYAIMDGTSMASPYVAATAALVRSARPMLTVPEVEALLTGTARDLGAVVGRDDDFGHGLVQPRAATPVPPRRGTTTRISLNDTTVSDGASVTATVRTSITTGGGATGPAKVCVRRAASWTRTCRTVAVVNGVAKHVLKASYGSYVYAEYAGTSTTSASKPTSSVRVYVTPKVTATAGYRKLSFKVSAAQRQRAAVQKATGKGWRTVRTVTVTGTGTLTVSRLQPGTHRVSVPRTTELQAVSSSSVRVR